MDELASFIYQIAIHGCALMKKEIPNETPGQWRGRAMSDEIAYMAEGNAFPWYWDLPDGVINRYF